MTIEARETGLKRLLQRPSQTYEIGETANFPYDFPIRIGNSYGSIYGTRRVTELPDRRLQVEVISHMRLTGFKDTITHTEAYETTVFALDRELGDFVGEGQNKKVAWKPSSASPQE